MSSIVGLWKKVKEIWRRVFAVGEIEESRVLYMAGWVLLLGWFLEFSTWYRYADFTVNAVQENRHLCWPFFQNCGDWYFLTQIPLGSSHNLVYALLFGVLVAASAAYAARRFVLAHVLFALLFVSELCVMSMAMRLAVNYWYFHALYAVLFLFATNKLLFLRIGVILLYFFSGVLKLNEGWLQGAYFTSLQEGLLFIPDALIPVATNAVIGMELVLVWFLLHPRRVVRLVVVGVLSVFHVYSAVYVGFTYPSVVLPMLLALFLFDERHHGAWWPLRKVGVGMGILTLFTLLHVVAYAMPGDARITGEWNRLRMYMFEANYQCVSRAVFLYEDGQTDERVSETHLANQRCDPYAHWFYFKKECARDNDLRAIAWTYDTSINGSPYMRIVDEQDACALSYSAWHHNHWIKLLGREEVELTGVPEKNTYGYPFR